MTKKHSASMPSPKPAKVKDDFDKAIEQRDKWRDKGWVMSETAKSLYQNDMTIYQRMTREISDRMRVKAVFAKDDLHIYALPIIEIRSEGDGVVVIVRMGK